jgi:DNA helicase-2/ATP-dependent DNA helicase PcrA
VEYTDQQVEILNYSGNCFVLARAGSGKTTTTIEKIRKLKREHPESRILYLTFTRKAKTHAIEKIGEVNNVLVTNYHGLAYMILLQHKGILQYNEIDIVSEAYSLKILESLFPNDDSYQLHAKYKLIEGILQEYKLIKNLSPVEKAIYLPYKEVMDVQKKLTYSDMIYKSNLLFERDQIHAHMRVKLLKFDYIFVDEIQDTNRAQYALIRNLMNQNQDAIIMGVGDTAQSLFGWRFAHPELVIDFIDDYSAKVFPLTSNFRSQENIVTLGNKVLGMMEEFKEYNDHMVSTKPSGDDICYFYYPGTQYQSVCNTISELIKVGYRYKDIYVLFRNNKSGIMFEKIVLKNKIPFKLLKGSFMSRKEVQYFINLVRFCKVRCSRVQNEKEIINYLKLFASEMTEDVGAKVFNLISGSKQEIKVMDKLRNIMNINIKGVGPKRKSSFSEMYQALIKCQDAYKVYMGDPSNEEDFYLTISKTVLEFKYARRANNLSFDYIKETLDALVSLLLEMDGRINDKINNLIIDYSGESNTKEEKDDYVLGMTVHKAKGSENKICFIIDLDQIPSSYSEDKEEEKRVLYVALTRAEEKLFITSESCFLYEDIFRNLDFIKTNVPFSNYDKQERLEERRAAIT